MSNNRIDAVVSDIVEGVRNALRKHDVTFEEYRAGMKFMMQTAEAKELPLLIDVFLNTTIVEIQNAKTKGSPSDLEGPYFLEDAPFVDGKIKVMEEFDGEPMLIRGALKDTDGNPVSDAVIDIWSSTPHGKYSGFHDDIPIDYYRGKIRTNADGRYAVESTVPVPYQIPNQGPTGALLEKMGRHSWRPAHIHFKIRKPGYQQIISQAYFEGGDWVNDDCCEGNHTNEFVVPKKYEGGKRLVELTFTMDRLSAEQAA